jgi:uncharacterized protein (DUF302 family)
MRRHAARAVLGAVLAGMIAMAAPAAENGIEKRQSPFSVAETTRRLETVLKAAGNTIFAEIDHGGGAKAAGLELRPTQLLIFGNPKAGTWLMQEAPTIAIDLPMKFLVFEDEGGKTWVMWNDVRYLAARHGLAGKDEALAATDAAIAGLAEKALRP